MLHNSSQNQVLNETYDYPYENVITTLSPTGDSLSESI